MSEEIGLGLDEKPKNYKEIQVFDEFKINELTKEVLDWFRANNYKYFDMYSPSTNGHDKHIFFNEELKLIVEIRFRIFYNEIIRNLEIYLNKNKIEPGSNIKIRGTTIEKFDLNGKNNKLPMFLFFLDTKENISKIQEFFEEHGVNAYDKFKNILNRLEVKY